MAVADPLEQTIEQLGYRERDGDLVDSGYLGRVAARSFVWRELQRKTAVDATYFRGSIPLVSFTRVDDREEAASVQRRLWNLSRVPLLITSTAADVGVYSCYAPPTSATDPSDVELKRASLEDVGTLLRDFMRPEVDSGAFAHRHSSQFDRRQRVDRKLLRNLTALRSRIARDGLK